MRFICHRVNTLDELRRVPHQYGVEIDLRDRGERLILQHDPFADGEDLEPYLDDYRHGTLILNVKSERVEHRALELVRRRGITDFFFLDSSFPMIYLLSRQGVRNFALRFSELEGLDTILAMRGLVDWVWVDCFTRLPLTGEIASRLRDAGFKLCLVSPELQGRPAEIEQYRGELEVLGIAVDAVCTKRGNIPRWGGNAGTGAGTPFA